MSTMENYGIKITHSKKRGSKIKKNGFGFVHVYTGEGKGKTTAATGLALRAIGNGLSVYMLQFMKAGSDVSGEVNALEKCPNATVERYGGNLLARNHAPIEEIKDEVSRGLEKVREIIKDKKCSLLILDEINLAVSKELVQVETMLKIIDLCKSYSVELVMTGRNASQEIINEADYVTEMKSVKHPFARKIKARSGIEF